MPWTTSDVADWSEASSSRPRKKALRMTIYKGWPRPSGLSDKFSPLLTDCVLLFQVSNVTEFNSILLNPAPTEGAEFESATRRATMDALLESFGGYIVHEHHGGKCTFCFATMEDPEKDLPDKNKTLTPSKHVVVSRCHHQVWWT